MKQSMLRSCMFFLVALILLSAGITVTAAEEHEKATLLSKLSIMQGYPDGELHLDKPVTRAEFTKIAVAASPYKNQVATGHNVSPFADVHYSHWAAPYVKLSVSNGLIKGYPDSTFRPDSTVLYEEAVTVCLRLLGYSNEDFGYSWPYGQIGLAGSLGLIDSVYSGVGNNLTRRDVMQMVYNLLECKPKGGSNDYIESLQYKLEEDVILIATHKEDSSVGTNKVYTSVGTFKIDDSFVHDYVGQKGTAVIKNGDNLFCFIPKAQSGEEYVVYSKLDTAIITYRDGAMGNLNVNDNTTAYMGTQKSTYAQLKNSMEMGDIITVQRNDDDTVEYITIREGNLVGPVTVRDSNWRQELSVNGDVTVMRNGVKVSADTVQKYDICYYSPDLNMILAYSKRVTGIYESASPNKDQLTSVTISGVTYQVESAEAFAALSSGGSVEYGDTVTVLLGKDGDIAGVMTTQTESSVVGFFNAAGVKNYTTSTGGSYSNYYVQIIGTDGQAFEFATQRDYRESLSLNQVVRVNFSNGLASVSTYKGTGFSGKVNLESRTIGNKKIAQAVNILDVVQTSSTERGAYASVFLQRLEGMQIAQNGVLYYKTNAENEVTDIILNDLTGECYSYGIITEANSNNQGMRVSGSYSYDINGVSGNVNTNGGMFSVSKGEPVQLLIAGGTVQNIKPLTKLSASVKQVTDSTLVGSDGTHYPLSGDVVVYHKKQYDHTIIPVSELMTGDYKIAAYHDKDMERGGRVRIIIAEKR